MEAIQAALSQLAQLQVEGQRQLNQLEQKQDRTQQQLDQLGQKVDSNARAIQATNQDLRDNIEDLTSTLTTYAAQAEQDRIALTASVQALVDALQNRFGGNGGG
ncbi:hypothetical protein K9N68_21270 [Kovacikia minuta CCNUW1]|uniref:hypothetical protein n=1 Tax=Kovacikia minuta TaxID=2931930 RepID=UPI001CCD07B7|nr:hypothetical protein [Kovacikia minuta]UBF24235.1 hypothetical protein K9N68_21270 [Kovacikia minuta CCNUW1]